MEHVKDVTHLAGSSIDNELGLDEIPPMGRQVVLIETFFSFFSF